MCIIMYLIYHKLHYIPYKQSFTTTETMTYLFVFTVSNTLANSCRVGSVGSVSASRTVGHEFASRPGHTKDHHKNGTNCLPAWHAMH